MLSLPVNYKVRNDAIAKQPVYVLEIIWAGGGHGTDGTNDIYFATCAVGDIVNFPYPTRWFPYLKADSISGISQNVDPINGVSTIGNLTATLTDHGGMVSDIIKAADAAGHGLRRQRVEVYLLHKGADWTTDKVKVRTLQVQDLKLSRLNEYTITAADVQTQLRKTVFNPAKTATTGALLASGALTVGVQDARQFKLGTSVKFGASGFVKIDSEIMQWTASTSNSFTVPSAGRGLFGTTPAAHSLGATVDEIFYLNENPITMALKIMESSGTAGLNGTQDSYPATWGCGLQSGVEVDEAGWLQVGELLTGLSGSHLPGDGLQFEFVLAKSTEAKKFIEDSILKIIGAYGFVRGDGLYSIRAYNDLANAAKENAVAWLTTDNVVQWGDLAYSYQDLANELWIDYDEEPKLSGKYVRSALFVDAVSQKKWGIAKQLKYVAQGLDPTSVFVNQIYQRFQRVMSRYSRPPMRIPLTLMPKLHTLEIGDIVRVTLPVRDLVTGASLDRAFEVVSVVLQTSTGQVSINCIAQPERASLWSGGVGEVASVVISPAAASIPNGSTQQLVARCFDGTGQQISTPAISWVASGNVTVSSSGLVTATAVGSGSVYAVVGALQSNVAVITVAAANSNPVSTVSVAPSSVTFAAGQTQSATAIAKDVSGNQVNGKTFTWASSNTSVATVPAGPSVSAIITAVANGTANITATETGSSIVSPACPVTVATPGTPTYTPPAVADVAYQKGTKITSMGPVGGPHTIPNGYNFTAGDYWFDGNVTLPLGSTCTINGTVRIFSLGVVTISGTVDGVGRGFPGAPSNVGPFIYPSSSVNGLNSVDAGFLGRGGIGQGCQAGIPTGQPYTEIGGNSPPSIYQSPPSINVMGVTYDGSGSITSFSGLPSILAGSGGGGAAMSNFYGYGTGVGGAYGGAGLMIMARGIYISVGLINLTGGNPVEPLIGMFGGAGGGGSFVALAERDIHGLNNMSIDPVRVYVGGGNQSSDSPYAVPRILPAGTPGCLITQVIG